MKPFFTFGDRPVLRGGMRARRQPLGCLATGILSVLVIPVFHLTAADGPVKAVQETLKKDQYLFEAPSGKMDEPTRAALRRFQIRRGLPGTGEIDAATLQALQNSAEGQTPAPASQAPPVPGVAPAVVDEDREFLNKVLAGSGKTPPPAEGPGGPHAVPPPAETPTQVATPAAVTPSAKQLLASQSAAAPVKETKSVARTKPADVESKLATHGVAASSELDSSTTHTSTPTVKSGPSIKHAPDAGVSVAEVSPSPIEHAAPPSDAPAERITASPAGPSASHARVSRSSAELDVSPTHQLAASEEPIPPRAVRKPHESAVQTDLAPVATKSSKNGESGADVEIQKTTAPEKHHQVADRKTESAPTAQRDETPQRRERPSAATVAGDEPYDTRERVASTAAPRNSRQHGDQSAATASGGNVTTYTTHGTDADGRAYTEKRTTVTSDGPSPDTEVRTEAPVEPRPRDHRFFHRLFHRDRPENP